MIAKLDGLAVMVALKVSVPPTGSVRVAGMAGGAKLVIVWLAFTMVMFRLTCGAAA